MTACHYYNLLLLAVCITRLFAASSTFGNPTLETALDYLAAAQRADGSFLQPNVLYGDDVAIPALAGLAFVAAGSLPNQGTYGKETTLCVKYLLSVVQENGLIIHPRQQNSLPMYGHSFAVHFLTEVYGAVSDTVATDFSITEYRHKLTAAVSLIVETQNADGGWRYQPKREKVSDVSVTATVLIALRSAHNAGFYVPKRTVTDAVSFLLQCQNSDGGFRYMAEGGPSGGARTVAVVCALQIAGFHHSDEVKNAKKYLKDRNMWPVSNSATNETKNTPTSSSVSPPFQEHFFYGVYYMAVAVWMASGDSPPDFLRWHDTLTKELTALQKDTGEWRSSVGDIPPDVATAMTCIVLALPRKYLPSFLP